MRCNCFAKKLQTYLSSYIFDPIPESWVKLGSMSTPTAFASINMARDGHTPIICGGRNGETCNNVTTACFMFSLSTMKLTSIASMATARMAHNIVTFKSEKIVFFIYHKLFFSDQLYIVGGMDSKCQPIGTIESYDPSHGGKVLDFEIAANNWTSVAVPIEDVQKENRAMRLSNASFKGNM
jgi:hypothetical protein